MSSITPGKSVLLGLLGAAAGGTTGYFLFLWIAGQGIYALALPGALLGLGAGPGVRSRSVLLAGICAVAATGLGLFCEWRFAPFIVDPGLGYFLGHLHQLRPVTLVMVLVGSLCGGFLALGISSPGARSRPAPTNSATGDGGH
jgi:hypothetical protein